MEKPFRNANKISDSVMESMNRIFTDTYMEESIKRMSENFQILEATEIKHGEDNIKTKIAENNFVDSGLRYLNELKRAVISENKKQLEELEEMDNLKLAQLGRAGLFDTSMLSKLKRALSKGNEKLTLAEKGMLVSLLDTLINQVLGNQQVFSKVKQNLASEEVEQIDELSKKTLGSYVKKATKSVMNTNKKIEQSKAAELRYWDNLPKDGSIDMGDVEDMNYSYDKNKKLEKSAKRRLKNVNRAIDKMSEETEPEQIDELSSGTLRSYVNKAHGDAERTHKSKQLGKPNTKANKRIGKRLSGMNRALGRLTREEAEELTEEKFGRYTVKYERGGIGLTLTNAKTKKSVFMQGEDVSQFEEDYIENDKFLDLPVSKQEHILSAYDDIMEEVEQIDELSQATMKSYSSKAKTDSGQLAGNLRKVANIKGLAKDAGKKDIEDMADKSLKSGTKKLQNRVKGLDRARTKIKEEAITLSKIKGIIGKPSKIVSEETVEDGNVTDKLFSEE